MDLDSPLSFKETFAQVVGNMACAVSERFGESLEQRLLRAKVAAQTILGFTPRDGIEAMIAGHCVMFHEMLTDSVRDTLRGETGPVRRATRANIVAMDNAFGKNLERLEHYQTRNPQGRPAERPAEPPIARDESDIADRTARHTAAREPDAPAPAPATDTPEPSSDEIADCLANSEAMLALNSGDPAGFARALGVEPCKEFLAAAASDPAVFNRLLPGNRHTHPINRAGTQPIHIVSAGKRTTGR